jgi:hypothetical protein
MDFLKDIEIAPELKTTIEQQFKSYVEETTKGLKANNDALLAEKKKAQEAAEQASALAKLENEEKLKAKNDYKQLFESQQQESAQLKQRLEEMMTKDKRSKISTEAARIAAGLTKDVGRLKMLEKELGQRLTLVDDQIRVADQNGQLTVSTINDLIVQIKTDYPFLVDGSQATGGGAARSSGGAGSGDKIITRADYDSMRPIERSKYMQAGGRVTD